MAMRQSKALSRKPKKTSKAKTPAPDPEGRELRISDLCGKLETYLQPEEVADIYRAYLFGAEAHDGQLRRSGEPYIYHPLAVASNLAEMHMDSSSITAAILHDVIEDTEKAKEHIVQEFGAEVAELVDGVSKISQIAFSSKEEEQAENFRKMLLAMSQDIRVILIKLTDRLHNMRTLSALPREKQQQIARETIDIYAPIANRLGVHQWALELEDLAFHYLYPDRYRVLSDAIRKRQGNRKAIIEKVRKAIVNQLKQEGVKAEVSGREKNIYSVYRKMRDKQLSFDQVYDVHGFRVLVDKVDTCYRILGIIHGLYKPIPGKFKDYIAIPKTNGYQSLHTIVFGPFGLSIEVQIRTEEMHRVADAGVAAHWLYKSGEHSTQAQQRALHWLKDLLDIQQKAGDPQEFLEHLKMDLFPDEVYVFTPNGEIKKLPHGATVVDFAYDVHTDIGNQCVSAKVNHIFVPLRTVLRNGDHVEVMTSDWTRPSPAWLDYVVTSKARANIRSYLKNQRQDESIKLGERLLSKALIEAGSQLKKIKSKMKKELLAELRLERWQDLLSEIGLGNRQASIVVHQLLRKETGELSSKKGLVLALRGTEGMVITYARCCHPIPGDSILGFLSAGKGIVVHTEDCPNVSDYRKHPEKWIDIQWEKDLKGVFPVSIRLDVNNKRGVLAAVAATISDLEANIDTLSFSDHDNNFTTMDFTLEVRDRVHLANIIRAIRHHKSVQRVYRRKG